MYCCALCRHAGLAPVPPSIGRELKKIECPRSKYCKDSFVVGVEIEVAADGDMRKAGLSNQDSIKAFVLYQVDFSGFIK
jgi:hypothetical protein